MKRYSSNNYSRFSKVPFPKEFSKPLPTESKINALTPFYLFSKYEKNEIVTTVGQEIKLQIKDPRRINFQTELELLHDTLLTKERTSISSPTQLVPIQWSEIIQAYSDTYNLPLSKQQHIHTTIHQAIHDVHNLAWILKYSWDVARPIQLDHSLKPLQVTPRYPSYPSGEAVVLGTVETLMTCFFPTKEAEIIQLIEAQIKQKKESGIHYPCDLTEGLRLGRHIGEIIIDSHGLNAKKIHIKKASKKRSFKRTT